MNKPVAAKTTASSANGMDAPLPVVATIETIDTAAATPPARKAPVRKAAVKAAPAKAAAKPVAAQAAVKVAAKPAAKAAAKPAAKAAVKPAAKAAVKTVAAKPAAKAATKAVAKPAAKSAKPAAKPAAKTAAKSAVKAAPAKTAAKVAAKPVDAAKDKPHKEKLVRDSFTMPEQEYAVLGLVKKACLKAGFEIKKSELLRIGVALISQIDLATLQNVLAALPQLKTGRPKKN
ncbi:hypothetical protein [Rugamonas rubra]|uniref:Histone H1-like nucleoprotein HC2 n=1 Tax=Rugamonas rubra TaxID=758825 RepID=A0A1I4TYN5_9BURK|nr:hypothetical protein [Rugamonas rubra]SFM81926.1 hypothetical protein SAMN02982985_05408 [Rugamonas rubra]